MSRISALSFLPGNQELSQPLPISLMASAALKQNRGLKANVRSQGAATSRLKRGRMPVLAALLLAGASAWAQGVFTTPQPVGTTAGPQTVTVTAKLAGTVSQVQVLTAGTSGRDFASGNGVSTCTVGSSLAVNATCTKSVTFTPLAPGLRIGAVVVLDATGRVLGTTYLSGTGQGGLGVLVPGNMTTVAGVQRNWTLTTDGILATLANLDQPSSITLDGAGRLFIADSTHNKIRLVAVPVPPATAGIISTYAGVGQADEFGDGGLATAAALSAPSGVALDGAGNLYIADTGNNAIRKIVPSTGIITLVAGTEPPASSGFSGDGGPATSAQLNQPQAVTVDASGNLYIADTDNQRIRRVDAVTGIITTVAGNGNQDPNGSGQGTFSGDGGPAINAGLGLPYAVAFDPQGNMYIPDSANHRIRKVDAVTGIITTFAGTATNGYSGDNGPATAAVLNTPSGVAVDPAGNVYIADTQNTAIRKVNAATGIITTLVVNGVGTAIAPDGTLGTQGVYAPIGLFLNGNGDLYFADFYYMMIRKVDSNQAVLDYTKTPVRQGSSSAPQAQMVENDGNAALDLTQFLADANAAVVPGYVSDPSKTACTVINPLAVDADCQVGVEFVPSLALVFPAGVTSLHINGNVDVSGNTDGHPLDTFNFPLDIIAAGIATPVNSTTLTLTSSTNPSVFGQNITFTATVTSGVTAGVPKGTVAFTDGITTLAAAVPLNALGVATYTTSIPPLAVGLHAIKAVFTSSASANFYTSSATLSQEVDEVSVTKLVSSVNPSTLGQSVTFTATVTAPNGGGVPPDEGLMYFTDSVTGPLAGSPILSAGGAASISLSTLTVGVHPITAVWAGDKPDFILGSTSNTVDQDVQAPTSMTLASVPNPSTFGQAVTFTATVAHTGTIAPTGVVSFLDGATQIGTGTLGATGVATFITSALTAGSHIMTASYPGDDNNRAATGGPVTQVVNKATPTITWPAPAAITYGTALSATQLDATSTVAGTFVYSPTAGTVLTAGTHTLGVTFTPTDAIDYTTATASVSITVNKATPVINWPAPAPITFGTPLSATQLDATSPVAGTFTYAPLAGTVLSVGTHTLGVTLAPTDSANYNTATASVSITVNQASSAITWPAPAPIAYGTPLSATQLNATAGIPGTFVYTPAIGTVLTAGTHTLSVVFTPTDIADYGTSSATVSITVTQATPGITWAAPAPITYGTPLSATQLNATSTVPGAFTYSPSAGVILAVGTQSLGVTFTPTDTIDYTPATARVSITVTQATTSTTVAAIPNPGIGGLPVSIIATVRVVAGAATVTGTVTFMDGSTTLGAAPLGASGTATINPTLAVGAHSIVATYAGDANAGGSVSAPFALNVVKATTSTVLTSSQSPSLVLSPVTFTAKVTGNGGIPTGTVTFASDGTTIGTSAVDATGTASFITSTLAAGTHSITATYAGDANDAGSASNAITQIVGTIPTVTGLTATTTTDSTPQVLLVAAVLNSPSIANAGSLPLPTGTVTFSNGTTVVGTAPVDSSGVATLIPNLATGTYILVAAYSGDAQHGASTSAPVTISTTPTGFSLTVTPNKVTIATSENKTVSVGIAITSTNGFTDTIGLGCGSLPAGVTCHFSAPTVTLGANGVQNVQLVIDTNNPLGGGASAMNAQPGGSGTFLAGFYLPICIFFGMIFWRFRKRYAAVFTVALVLLLGGATMLVTGCSGLTQSSAAPGTYVIQVTGVGATSNITRYQNVTLTITK